MLQGPGQKIDRLIILLDNWRVGKKQDTWSQRLKDRTFIIQATKLFRTLVETFSRPEKQTVFIFVVTQRSNLNPVTASSNCTKILIPQKAWFSNRVKQGANFIYNSYRKALTFLSWNWNLLNPRGSEKQVKGLFFRRMIKLIRSNARGSVNIQEPVGWQKWTSVGRDNTFRKKWT